MKRIFLNHIRFLEKKAGSYTQAERSRNLMQRLVRLLEGSSYDHLIRTKKAYKHCRVTGCPLRPFTGGYCREHYQTFTGIK